MATVPSSQLNRISSSCLGLSFDLTGIAQCSITLRGISKRLMSQNLLQKSSPEDSRRLLRQGLNYRHVTTPTCPLLTLPIQLLLEMSLSTIQAAEEEASMLLEGRKAQAAEASHQRVVSGSCFQRLRRENEELSLQRQTDLSRKASYMPSSYTFFLIEIPDYYREQRLSLLFETKAAKSFLSEVRTFVVSAGTSCQPALFKVRSDQSQSMYSSEQPQGLVPRQKSLKDLEGAKERSLAERERGSRVVCYIMYLDEIPGLISYQFKSEQDRQAWDKLIAANETKIARVVSKEIEGQDDKSKNRNRETQLFKQAADKFSLKKASKQERREQLENQVIEETKQEKRPRKQNALEQLLERLNYSVYNKQLQQINQDNIKRLFDELDQEKLRIEENIKKIIQNSHVERKGSKVAEVEEEKKKLKDISRLKRLYRDKLTLRHHIDNQHRVIHNLSAQFLQFKTSTNSKVLQFDNITRQLPLENDRLNKLINQNKRLREDRDRQAQLRRQLQDDVTKRVKDFHSLYQEALVAKKTIVEQLQLIMKRRDQLTREALQSRGLEPLDRTIKKK